MSALLHSLPYALVNAASPTIPIAAVALMAVPGRGRRSLLWYFIGCASVVVVTTALFLTVFVNVNLTKVSGRHLPTWVDVIAGSVLIVLGIVMWKRGPRKSTGEPRAWSSVGPLAIIGIGAYMELINLFTPPAYLVGIIGVTQQHLAVATQLGIVTIDAIVVLAPVWGLIILSAVAPSRTDDVVGRVREFFHRYGHITLVIVFLAVGVYLVGKSVWAFLA